MSGPQSVTATFGQATNPQVTPGNLVLEYFQGTDPATAARVLNVSTDDGSRFSVTVPDSLVRITPLGGTTPGSVTVTPNATTQAPGYYTTTLTFTFADGSTIPVVVAVRVWGPPQLALTVASQAPLNFTAQAGSTVTQSRDITVAALVRNVTVQVAFTTASGTWLAVTPGSGTTSLPLHVQVDPTGLAVGVYPGTITLTSADASNSPLTLPVTLTITPPPPSISISSLVNAASLQPGAGAPNEIVTALGSFPGCTSAQVLVNGSPTTVFFSSPTQVNFLLSAQVAGVASISVQISCAGLTSTRTMAAASVSPAIFTVSQRGTGQAAIVNQDSSIATPSPAGTYIQVYVTGFGLPPLQVTATIAGLAAMVQYAGEAPGYTAGLQQINVLIPANTPPGSAVPLQLTVGGATTQSNVTLAIRAREGSL